MGGDGGGYSCIYNIQLNKKEEEEEKKAKRMEELNNYSELEIKWRMGYMMGSGVEIGINSVRGTNMYEVRIRDTDDGEVTREVRVEGREVEEEVMRCWEIIKEEEKEEDDEDGERKRWKYDGNRFDNDVYIEIEIDDRQYEKTPYHRRYRMDRMMDGVEQWKDEVLGYTRIVHSYYNRVPRVKSSRNCSYDV